MTSRQLKDKDKALRDAAEAGKHERVRALLKQNAHANAKGEYGWTALHLASREGHNAIVQTLLSDNSVPVNETSVNGWTALFFAARSGQLAVVNTLLNCGAVVNIADDRGHTPLHSAALRGGKDVVAALLHAKASVNAKDEAGWTPLHNAAFNGRADVVQLLVEHDANVNDRTNEGMTALDFAAEKRHAEVVAILQAALEAQPPLKQSAEVAFDIAAAVAEQHSVTRVPPAVVLEVDWQLVLSRSGLQHQLDSMQASIAANERAQAELRAADALLDKRIEANNARILEHEQRLVELEERQHTQSVQLDILQELQTKPAQLLFYRTLLINTEAVFLSCKATAGGFVDVTGAARATKVCGTVLPLLPGGELIRGAATAAALEQATAAHRHDVAAQLGKNLTQAEASQVASDVAYRLTEVFAAQLELLAPIEPHFLSFLRSVCGVGGKLVEAYVTSGSEVIATAAELAKGATREQATELLASQFGALVGSVADGPDPFASVLADFCFVCILAELENVRARETPIDIIERLVRGVLDVTQPTSSSSNESGAHRLLSRLCGAVKSTMPSRSLSVFIRAPPSASAPWREVRVFDLLTRCGVRTANGIHYASAHCDPELFGWCEASEEQAGRRGLVMIPVPPGASNSLLRNAMRAAPPAVVVEHAPKAPNEFRRALYGKCTQCACEEYVRPVEGARCDVCECAVMKHAKIESVRGRTLSRSPSPAELYFHQRR